MKKCPNGHEVGDNVKFCPTCGAGIISGNRFCTKCGNERMGAEKFCPKCGTPFDNVINDEIVTYEEEQPKSGFKKYLPYILGGILLLGIIGYFNSEESNKSSNLNENEVQATDSIAENVETKTLDSGADYTEEDIKNTLESMYKEILNPSKTVYDNDSKYTSAEYQSILNKAENVAVDEVVLDADHWIQGQDCDKPSMSVESVKKESDTKAIAEVKIKLFQGDDYQSRVRLVLLFENGKWVVDDFISFGDGGEEYSEKAYLKKYIDDCQSKPKEDYSSSSSNTSSSSSRTFYSEQIVIGYLANQSFRASDGLTMRVDGDGRLYVDGDYAGVLSVLRYSSTAALLRYGGGMYGEGKLTVNIVGDKFTLTDPTDGTVYYQR